ncbi:MAG: c-type cytochrome [Pirellulaceae bacterium]
MRLQRTAVTLLVLAAVSGCDRVPDHFEVNREFARKEKLAESAADFALPNVSQRMADIDRVLTSFFGTPSEPVVPVLEGAALDSLFQLPTLQRAAGAVRRDAEGTMHGLYRNSCVQCHGVTGDGRGSAARGLDPYPRDYRRGIFKYKRTPSTLPPTDEDLRAVLDRGVPGTAMPSFGWLPDSEKTALVEYVRYLTIRGMFERSLISEVAVEFDDDDRLLNPEMKEISPTRYAEQVKWLEAILADVVQPWLDARTQVTAVPAPPANYNSQPSIARGRELFFTTLTNCGKCHGDTSLGDGQTEDYDEWTKDLEPTNPEALADYLALGALPPRKAQPRDQRSGLYRGGQQPEDLFVKIKNGIAGTTMPSVATQLSDDDVWHLVAYVRHLPNDPLSLATHTESPAGAWPSHHDIGLPGGLAAMGVVALILSSLVLELARRSWRRGKLLSARPALAVVLVLGSIVLALRVEEYRTLHVNGISLWHARSTVFNDADVHYVYAVKARLKQLFTALEDKRTNRPDIFSDADQQQLELVMTLQLSLVGWTEQEVGHWLDDTQQRRTVMEVLAYQIHPVADQRETIRDCVEMEKQELNRRRQWLTVLRDFCQRKLALLTPRKESRPPSGTASNDDPGAPVDSGDDREFVNEVREKLRRLGGSEWAFADAVLQDAADSVMTGERLNQINAALANMDARATFVGKFLEPLCNDPLLPGLNRQFPFLRLPVSFPRARTWVASYALLTSLHSLLLLSGLGVVLWRLCRPGMLRSERLPLPTPWIWHAMAAMGLLIFVLVYCL